MSWMQTYSGHRFSFVPDDFFGNVISILDISHALSNICRFGGHAKSFYSVAQHSVLVSHACPTKPLAGLLHDATEAYIGDMVRPLKIRMPEFELLEQRIAARVAFRFNIDDNDFHCQEIKHADNLLLATEKRDVLARNDLFWELELPEPAEGIIIPQPPSVARRLFMDRFYELTGVKERWRAEDEKEDQIREAALQETIRQRILNGGAE